MPRISNLAVVVLSGALVVAGGVGAALAVSAGTEPELSIAPITLNPQASPLPDPSTTITPSGSETPSPTVVQPAAPHDLGDDHGGDDGSGHGGNDDSGDDSGGHGSDDD